MPTFPHGFFCPIQAAIFRFQILSLLLTQLQDTSPNSLRPLAMGPPTGSSAPDIFHVPPKLLEAMHYCPNSDLGSTLDVPTLSLEASGITMFFHKTRHLGFLKREQGQEKDAVAGVSERQLFLGVGAAP